MVVGISSMDHRSAGVCNHGACVGRSYIIHSGIIRRYLDKKNNIAHVCGSRPRCSFKFWDPSTVFGIGCTNTFAGSSPSTMAQINLVFSSCWRPSGNCLSLPRLSPTDSFKIQSNLKVATGRFGADMKVTLENDGPVTIWIDTKNKE